MHVSNVQVSLALTTEPDCPSLSKTDFLPWAESSLVRPALAASPLAWGVAAAAFSLALGASDSGLAAGSALDLGPDSRRENMGMGCLADRSAEAEPLAAGCAVWELSLPAKRILVGYCVMAAIAWAAVQHRVHMLGASAGMAGMLHVERHHGQANNSVTVPCISSRRSACTAHEAGSEPCNADHHADCVQPAGSVTNL